MDNTAIAKITSPDSTPNDNGTAPIAACTVAFGTYAITQNNFSFKLKFVPNKG